jgi:cytoskeletal protein CcmA (bactofilin family)
MRIRRGLLILGLGCLLLVVLANAVRHAVIRQPLVDSSSVALGQSYQFDGQLDDDLAALAETIDLKAGSVVHGDAALIGGTITINGRINGDLTAVGESLSLGPTAEIMGEATFLVNEVVIDGRVDGVINVRGENLKINPDAKLAGDIFACTSTLSYDNNLRSEQVRPCNESETLANLDSGDIFHDADITLPPLNIHVGNSPAAGWLFSILGALALSGLSILAVVIFPRQVSHMEESIRANPRSLGQIGFMVFLLAIGISFAFAVILAILPPLGVLLIPVYFIAALIFFGMTLAGWITVALLFGDLLLRRFTRTAFPPLVTAAVGNFTLFLVWQFLMYIPLAALLALAIPTSIGLGAAVLTRMGTKPSHRSYFVQG